MNETVAHFTSTSLTWSILATFFQSGFSFTYTGDSQGSMGREWTICYSTLPLTNWLHRLANIRTFICNFAYEMTWRIFNRIASIYQNEIYDLIEINIWFMDDAMLIFVCLLDSRGGVLQQFDTRNRWMWIVSTITLVLQTNRLTKSASHTDYNFGRWTLVRQHPMKSLSSICPSVHH